MKTNFNDNLHEDLFDLFILNWFIPSKMACIDNEHECDIELARMRVEYPEFYSLLRDLFPQELHPEQYECYTSERGMAQLKTFGSCNEILFRCKMEKYQHKILITVEQE